MQVVIQISNSYELYWFLKANLITDNPKALDEALDIKFLQAVYETLQNSTLVLRDPREMCKMMDWINGAVG